jgi:uncharacterized protein (DUF2147 family)
MKNPIRLIAIILILFFITNYSFSQSEIIGIWFTQDKEAKVQIFQTESGYYGKIIWLKKSIDEKGNPVLDKNNPKDESKKRQLMNLVILNGFTYEDKEWIGGIMYDPTDGGTYECKIWIENKNTLKVRGYLGFLYETESWTRVK